MNTEPQWWDVVKVLAGLVSDGFDKNEITEGFVKSVLLEQNFAESDIDRAFDWVEKAMLSGTLTEALSMIQSPDTSTRVMGPLEQASLNHEVWARLQNCRSKGLLSDEMMERILEGVRVLDTRDWDKEEISSLLAGLLSSILPDLQEEDCLEIIEGQRPYFYS